MAWRWLRASLLVFLIMAALSASAYRAEAAGTPKQLIIFTDKKVYTDWVFSQDKRSTNAPNIIESATQYDLMFYVYAVVLDDDGNMMRGRTSYLSGTINDIAQLDHYNKGSAATHHSNVSDPNLLSGTLIFRDDGTVAGDVSGDGVYTAVYNPADFADSWGASNVAGDDHYKINVTVTDSNMGKTTYTYVLLNGIRCHQGYTHGSTHIDGVMPGGVDNCAVCHPGYEHFYENISGTIPESMQDVHLKKVAEPSVISDDKGFGDFVWNTSYTQASSLTGIDWRTYWPGSGYCPFCHTNSGGTVLDYSGGGRTTVPLTRPSCSETSGFYGSCHPNTEMAGTAVVDWSQSAGTTVKRQNYNISMARSHNHSSNKANVSCAVCHRGSHALTMPNMSADISSSGILNNQCVLCHDIAGGLNIIANGGNNVNHTSPDCKACHMDSAQKLDSHLVPTAGIPNANCTECHDLGGISPYHIDFNTFNKSDYVHNMYNASAGRRPLNFNASNGSAVRPAENKICWGCHGDDPNNDGRANYSEQPAGNHPSRYKKPWTCEQCHQNASAPWDAPQNVAHSFNTSEVRTPGAPNCYDCHGQPVMYNNSHSDPDYNASHEKGLKATLANHYGTGFPALAASRGHNGYCIKYCHQNTSSPFELEFYNKENMQRPNHSSMTTRPQNQSCRDAQCHAADKIHEEKMRKPTLAGGTFGNANCTAAGCHSPADSGGFNYSPHNGKVNCTSCHMDNIGANIHPIKYLQDDGKDFAQMNLTAASCKLCHKNSQGDAVLSRWGVSPRKVGSQHHSNDPRNGSKWNKSIKPYWDYVPNEITFVSGWKNNSNRGYLVNFGAMQDTNYSAGRISENTTQDAFFGSYPENHEFNSTEQANGWYANGTGILAWSSADGNPPGGLTIASTSKGQAVDARWTASFIYNKTGRVAQATLRLDSKLVRAVNIDTGFLKAVNVTIDDNLGNVTEVYNRSLPNTAEPDWLVGEISIPDPEAVFWKNSTLDHSYNLTIRTRWTGLGGKLTPNIEVAHDNVFVNISEVDYKKYNFTLYINNTPSSDRYSLVISYQTHVEPAKLYILNGSSFKYRADLDSGAFTKAIVPLSEQEYGNGNITLRINDSNSVAEPPGATDADIDVKADYIEIEYMFIDSYRWINNSRVHYPCEYCHASNKHFQHALGMPYEFKGDNYVGQNVNGTTTWCTSCHYQGYSSGTKNYADVVNAFLNSLLPVPPEITGHSLYGVNKNQSPDYYEHSGLSSYNDSICWNCHKGKLADGSNSTVFLHNVTAGTSGGRNCTACHGHGGSAAGMLVNFTSVAKGMHASLNKNASSTPQNASSKPCWGCHGTLNGSWANESDQPLADHNATFKDSARKCHDCHSSNAPLFNAKPVTDHIPSGLSTATDVITSKYDITYCAYCHNNSVDAGYDPDDLGKNPMNASTAHYGANRTKGMLMSAANNSTDCNFCHRNDNNMVKWGVLRSSSANISNKNGTSGTGTNHSPFIQSSQCYSCHGGSVLNFHVASMSPGEKGSPDCAACHNMSSPGNYPKVDFAAINASVHGGLNKQASSSSGNASNKPCWGCHGTKVGAYANESDQPSSDHNNTYKSSPRKCEECHINGSIQFNAPGLTEHIMPGRNDLTQINVSEGYCSFCHNNSLTPNDDNDGVVINASSAHYAKDANGNLMTIATHSDNCTYCHFVNNESTDWLTPRKPLTLAHSSYSNSTPPSTCWGCHVDSRGEPPNFHSQEINRGAGSGPNCRNCHNISDTDGNRGHIDSGVFNSSIHGSMNTTGGIDLNEPCWGCHGNGSSEGHNTSGDAYGKGMYRNPYNCTDCHLSTGIRYAWASARSAMTVAEHYSRGMDIRASYNATTTFSCLKCHQDTDEMLNPNSDPDTGRTAWTSGGDNYSSIIGGSGSPYHYGKKRPDVRNASCSYCHQNSSTAFAPAMQNQLNRSIYEHTDNGTRNTSAGSCTGGNCHSSGFIHNSSLKRPPVQIWTPGKQDYCAPCHSGNGSSLKINNTYHNTTSGDITDCGYCHNSEAMKSSAPQRIHSFNLTRGGNSTFNNCYNCHQNGFTKKVIFEHTNSTGANITNASMTCEKSGCHYSNRTHARELVKPVMTMWTGGGNDFCAPCHNSSDSTANATRKVYRQGHDPANRTNDGITSCANCHNASTPGGIPISFKLHDSPLTDLTDSNDSTCIGCHNGSSLYVGEAKQMFSHIPDAAKYRGNTSMSNYTCESCHNLSGKPSMHSAGMNRSAGTCITCHFNRTSQFRATKKIIANNDYNHTYIGQKSCNISQCHNASGKALGFHLDRYAAGVVADPERVNSVWSDRNNSGNGFTDTPNVDCIDCHREHNNTYPFNNTPQSFYYEANRTGENRKNHSTSDSIESCYNCHTNRTSAVDRYMVHNVTIEPLMGGPACVSCHNLSAPSTSGYPPATRKVNHTAFNQSVHRNLTNYTVWNESKKLNSVLLDSACWTCHATNITDLPNNAHPDRGGPASIRPFQCNECHPVEGNISNHNPPVYQNATRIYQHYSGKSFLGSIVFNSTKGCYECHRNSLVSKTNVSYSTYNYGNEANVSHYTNRSGLIPTNDTPYGCNKCHAVGGTGGVKGVDYGNAIGIPITHYLMGSTEVACQKSCHNSDPVFNITLHGDKMGIYIGTNTCYYNGCHTPPPPCEGDECRR